MPGSVIAELLTVSKKLDNYEIDPVTGLKVLWVDTTHFRVTCPAGKRWFLLGGSCNRNVSSTLETRLYDDSDAVIRHLFSAGAAAALTDFPAIANWAGGEFILDAGDYIESVFGTAQDASSYHSCQVLEVDI